MVKEGKLTKEEARKKVNEMIKKGWRISQEVYLSFIELLDMS